MRWVPRERVRPAALVAAPLAAVVLSAGLSAALFAAAGAPPGGALWALVSEPFGSAWGISETLLKATPLAFCALAVALARKIDLWNIGAEGQLYMGAFGAAGAALYGDALLGGSPWAALSVALLAGAALGALWAAIPALLKIYAGVSEILSTLMLNYVAIAWVELWVFGPWKGADGFPYTAYIGEAWRLPELFRRAHWGLVLAVALAIALYWIERRTAAGYEVRVAGASAETARYAGLPVVSRLLGVMCVAGAMAGLAGATEILGSQHRLHAGISPGYGYTAIIVAFLARRHLIAALFVALGFAALSVGGEGLQISYPEVSSAIVRVFEGSLLLFALGGDTLARYRIVFGRVGGVAGGEARA